MAITAETRQDIMELAVAANNAAPGTTLLSTLVAMSESGSSLLDIANELADSASFKATYPTFQTATEFATEFLGNLVPEASADALAEGVAIIEGLLAAGTSRGAIILEAASYLSALDESNAAFGSSAALFNNRVEVATAHTITNEEADSWDIPASVTSDDDSVAAGTAEIPSVKAAAAAAAKAKADEEAAAAAAKAKADEEAAAAKAKADEEAAAAAAEKALEDAATEAAAAADTAIADAAAADAALKEAKDASDAAAATAAETDADALATALEAATTADTDAKAALEAATKAYNDAITAGDATAVVTKQGEKIIAQDKADKAAAALVEATEASEAATAADEAAATAAAAYDAALEAANDAGDAADAAAAAAVEAAAATADTDDDAAAAAQVTEAAAATATADEIASDAAAAKAKADEDAAAAAAAKADTDAVAAAKSAADAAVAASAAANTAAADAIAAISDNASAAAALVKANAAADAADTADTATDSYVAAAAKTADADDDTAAAALDATATDQKAAAAGYVTTATAEAAVDRSPQSISLTTGLDTKTGGAGNDVFSAVLQAAGTTGTTISAGDNVKGGSGSDTLNVAVAGNAGGYTLSAVQTDSVEKVLLNNFSTAATLTIDASLMDGLEMVGLFSSSATGDTAFTNVKSKATAWMGNGNGDLSVSFSSSVGTAAGTADEQNLSVNNITGGTFTADANVETLIIDSSTAKNTLTGVTAAGATKLTVTGDQKLTIGGTVSFTTIDASANTGGVVLALGSANQKITGTATTDYINGAGTIAYTDVIDGGDGVDTLRITVGNATIDANTSTAELRNVSNVENLRVGSTNDGATIDLSSVSGFESVQAQASTRVVSLAGTNESVGDTVTFTLNGTEYTSGAITATAGGSTTDSAEEVVAAKINSLTGFTATAGADSVTITRDSGGEIEYVAKSVSDAGGLAVGGGADGGAFSVATDQTSTGYTNLLVKGITTQSVDIHSADAVEVQLKDASGAEDVVNVNLRTGIKKVSKAMGTLTANNIETLNLDNSGSNDAVITTIGAITGNLLGTLNITGDSDTTISGFSGSTKLVTINGSTSTGDLSIAAAPAAKNQVITTGSGNDTITMGAFLTAADVIDGGGNSPLAKPLDYLTGDDKLTATGNIGTITTSSVLQIANVEVIELTHTGSAVAHYIDASSITGAETIAFANDTNGGSVTISNLAAGTAIGLGTGASTANVTELGKTAAVTIDAKLADATGDSDTLTFDYADGTLEASTVSLKVGTDIETVSISAGTKGSAVTSTITNTYNYAGKIAVSGGKSSSPGGTTALGTLSKYTKEVDAGSFYGNLTMAANASSAAMTVTARGDASNPVNITTSAFSDTITLSGKSGTNAHTVNAAGGTGDTLNVTLDNAASDFTNVSNVEIVNITIGANTQAGFDDATKDNGINTAALVTISGGDALSTFTFDSGAIIDDDASPLSFKLDASAFGGSLSNIDVASDAFDAELSIIGTAAVTDKVTAIIAGVDNKVAQMDGIETLVIKSTDGDTAAKADLTNVTGLVTLDAQFVATGAADQIEVAKVPAGTKVKTTMTETGDNLKLGMANASAADTALDLTITEFSDTSVTTEVLNVDAAGVESLKLTMKNSNAGKLDLAGVTASTGSTVAITVAGAGVAEITALASTVASVDATGATGNLIVGADARSAGAMTLTGGVGDDNLAMENAGDILTGGLATNGDTLTVNFAAILGGIEVDLSKADQVLSMNGTANAAVQTGFENVNLSSYTGFGAVITGSSVANSITGTASADQITGGNGADIIDGGLGNDTITLTETVQVMDTVTAAASYASVDTIVGWDDSDKLDVTTATAQGAISQNDLGSAVDIGGVTGAGKSIVVDADGLLTVIDELVATGGDDTVIIPRTSELSALATQVLGEISNTTVVVQFDSTSDGSADSTFVISEHAGGSEYAILSGVLLTGVAATDNATELFIG